MELVFGRIGKGEIMKRPAAVILAVVLIAALGAGLLGWRLTTNKPATTSSRIDTLLRGGHQAAGRGSGTRVRKDVRRRGASAVWRIGNPIEQYPHRRLGRSLYLAADESYIRLARQQGLLAEAIPLARMRPVVAVAKGNPKNVRTLDDLLPPGRPRGPGQSRRGFDRPDDPGTVGESTADGPS